MYNNTPQSLMAEVPDNIQVNMIGAKFIEVPATQPLHYRPISVHVSQDGIRRLQETTQGGAVINEATLREIARDIIKPSDTSRGIIGINGGWDQSRCSVFFMFEIKSPGMTIYEVLSGYTNYAGISHNYIDPEIIITPNSLIRVNTHFTHGAMGKAAQMTPSGNQNILTPISITAQTGSAVGQFAMRPSDIITGWQNNIAKVNPDGFDTRTDMARPIGIASDKMTNGISAKYLNRVLTSYSVACNQSEKHLAHNDRYLLGTAAAQAREPDFTASQLFSLLSKRTQFAASGSFTWRELCGAVHSIDQSKIKPVPLGAGIPSNFNTESWGAYGPEVQVAHKLTQAVPAVVTQALGSVFSFTAMRDPINGHTVIPSTFLPMFDNMEDARFMQSAMSAIQNVILPEVINDATVGQYEITVDFVIGGDMQISVSLNGQPSVPFTMPCYCDAMGAANIAVSKQEVNENGVRISNVIENTFVAVSPTTATEYI